MKKIFYLLKNHIQDDFDWKLYGTASLFLVIFISINYYFDFEDSVIDAWRGRPIRILWYFLLYAFAYYSGILMIKIFRPDKAWLSDKRFWFYSLFGLALMALDGGFPWILPLGKVLFPKKILAFGIRCLWNMISMINVVLPLFVLYYFGRYLNESSFYGITRKNAKISPYFFLILLMIPLVYWASFQPDFLKTYPKFKNYGTSTYLEVPRYVVALVYETTYAINFISVELLFRGFLVIGLGILIGKDAIIPMVLTYAFLHFGKPLGETIGSIFGGYILGVLAYYTQNIWGGVIAHIGLAWSMDFFAYIQKYN